MSKVFITQVPSRRDSETGALVPTCNISPAVEHGEVVIMMPPDASFFATAELVKQLEYHLRYYDFEGGDALVALGDPAIIAAASAILGKMHGSFRLLKWDRMVKRYVPNVVRV